MAETPAHRETTLQAARQGRPWYAFGIAIPIGVLGGLIGLGGAEFRLPVLAGPLGYVARRAVALNVAISLITVLASLAIRGSTLTFAPIAPLLLPMGAMIAGALVTAFIGTSLVGRFSNERLEQIILVFLVTRGTARGDHPVYNLESGPWGHPDLVSQSDLPSYPTPGTFGVTTAPQVCFLDESSLRPYTR